MNTSPPSIAASAAQPAPDAIADPALRRLVDQVCAARSDGSALLIRGGGTKDFYGGADGRRGSLLETSELRGICSYDPTEMVITVRAGTPLAEVEAALAERGQHLAFEPPRFDSGSGAAATGATVGGMVAAGLSGPAR